MTAHHRRVAKEAEGLAVSIAAAELLKRLPVDPHAETHRRELAKAMGWQCVIDGCERQARAVAMCETHYRAYRNIAKELAA